MYLSHRPISPRVVVGKRRWRRQYHPNVLRAQRVVKVEGKIAVDDIVYPASSDRVPVGRWSTMARSRSSRILFTMEVVAPAFRESPHAFWSAFDMQLHGSSGNAPGVENGWCVKVSPHAKDLRTTIFVAHAAK